MITPRTFTKLLALMLCALAVAAVAVGRGPASRGSSGPPCPDVLAVAASSDGLTAAASPSAQESRPKPAAGAKVYRGSILGRGIEVSLRREGGRVTGSYNYDGRAERLRLEGSVGADGKLALAEYDRAGRQTGKFACEPGGGSSLALDIDLECEWSRADGSDQTYAGLTEQHAEFTRAWRVEPREIVNRRYGVGVTYPQIVAARGARLTTAALSFNRAAAALASKIVREFAAGPPERGMYLRANYDVLLATDDLISVELEEERDFGGGRPGTRFFGLTHDLRAGRALRLADLFKTGSDFERALTLNAYERINRVHREINRREAAPGAAAPEAEDLLTPEGAAGIEAWALAPRGVLIYFNFPQVMAAFSRNLVPYSVFKDLLRADGPAAPLAREAR